MRILCHLTLLLFFCIDAFGQYAYIDSVYGTSGDMNAEGAANIEVFDGQYYTWGRKVTSGQPYEHLAVYSPSGAIVTSEELFFPDAFVYPGLTNSFKRIPDEEAFLVTHSIESADGMKGFLMKVDSNLDTLWCKKLEIFEGYTYIYTHAYDGDGFILAGEYGLGPGQRGTFIAKVDLDGEYLWHEILHEPSEGAFRNQTISVIPQGYLVSGGSGAGLDTEGQIEFFNSESGQLTTVLNESSAILRGIMAHTVKEDGEVIVIQNTLQEDYPGSTNPSFAYSRQYIYRFDPQTGELQELGEYFEDNSIISGGALKIIESHDNSMVMVGLGLKEVDDTLRSISFAMRVDEEYEVDWYTELSYDQCAGCTNELYDIEQAPDGGYVMVGGFTDQVNDPYTKTWLVKVDACGELEYSGCAPVGLSEFGSALSQLPLEVYPNPANERVQVVLPEAGEWERITVIDISGQEVMRAVPKGSTVLDSAVPLDVSTLGAGLYSIILRDVSGRLHTARLLVQ